MDKVEETSYLLKCNDKDINCFLKTSVNKDYAKPGDQSVKDKTKDFIAESKKLFSVSIINQIHNSFYQI